MGEARESQLKEEKLWGQKKAGKSKDFYYDLASKMDGNKLFLRRALISLALQYNSGEKSLRYEDIVLKKRNIRKKMV